MAYTVRKEMEKKVYNKELPPREGVALINYFENCLEGYTYLKKIKELFQ
jgi:arginine decarboxylase